MVRAHAACVIYVCMDDHGVLRKIVCARVCSMWPHKRQDLLLG